MEKKEIRKVKLINPYGTKWSSFEASRKISNWIEAESKGQLANMLPQKPEDLLSQMKIGLTFLAVIKEKLVGHVTFWRYETEEWGEVGSLIVDPLFRNKGIGKELVKALSQHFSNHFYMVTTTKKERARHVFLVNDFDIISFDEMRNMSESAWRECCPCFFPPKDCPKRDNECRLLIRRK